jgi:thiamine-phosphate pyrophosphorylase
MPGLRLKRGLYLITPDEPDGERLLARTLPLLPFASCLQLRNKMMDADTLRVVGMRLRGACADVGVMFIVNDDPSLAHPLAADGVHLGEDDSGIAEARTLLGNTAIIGASCYDDLQRARDAVAAGADNIAFGAFFPSPTKPLARRAGLDLLRDSAGLGVPRVAIGGITAENASPLVDAGADLVAVISGVFDAVDPVAAARAYLSCFEDIPTA